MSVLMDTLGQRTVGELAATLPGATAVFREFKLNFCCGGDVPLAQAAARRGADLALLQRRLSQLEHAGTPAQQPASSSELMTYLLGRYRAVAHVDLPELVLLARKVERVHGNHPAAPRGLADGFEQLLGGLQARLDALEHEVFPALRENAADAAACIAPQREAQQSCGRALEHIEGLAHEFRLPEGACRSWQALYAGGSKLVDDLIQLTHLEANVLYPRFEH